MQRMMRAAVFMMLLQQLMGPITSVGTASAASLLGSKAFTETHAQYVLGRMQLLSGKRVRRLGKPILK